MRNTKLVTLEGANTITEGNFILTNHITMFNQKDIQQIQERGADPREVSRQVDCFRNGFPWMKIVGPATPERGIKVMDPAAVKEAVAYYKKAIVDFSLQI